MEIFVTKFESIDLPNYQETIWRGEESKVVEAPLLGKYCVTIKYKEVEEKLFFEVRKQPSGPLIDEYYEDQIWGVSEKIAEKSRGYNASTVYNSLMQHLSPLVFEAWEGENHQCPFAMQINT